MFAHLSFSVSPVIRHEKPPSPSPVSFKTILQLLEESMSFICGENSSKSKFVERLASFRLDRRSSLTGTLLNGFAELRRASSCCSINQKTRFASSVFL